VLPLEIDAADRVRLLPPSLIRVAYRVLGFITEGENVTQEAWLHWHRADRSTVRDPTAISLFERSFLWHDVFGHGSEKVVATIRPDSATCRQTTTQPQTHS